MYFIRMSGVSVVGLVAEMLVRVEGSRVETHPIAGTRPRGRNDEEDMRLAEELKRNEKERASTSCSSTRAQRRRPRSASTDRCACRSSWGSSAFSHVMHLTVDRRRASSADEPRSARRARVVLSRPARCRGAPKVRAMQIIKELEPSGRGLYAGAVGYLDFAGNLDFCIAIRTVIMSKGQGLRAGRGGHRDGFRPRRPNSRRHATRRARWSAPSKSPRRALTIAGFEDCRMMPCLPAILQSCHPAMLSDLWFS
jgi:anthranilate synthase component 1